ncbi:tandem-95 repeat protein [Reinekea blandensis]|uniref:Putative RTX toxin n=1 Tax=Reinekea blandensis MED297 TaxID=314283 RepID=A4BAS2_9GAMM|nr:tandem-95 repeat protein [Reinekea blandensis]EAR11028.1 putative RTX toxin [Reinekea sp. MED297] [Reinekea blandensis MED297]
MKILRTWLFTGLAVATFQIAAADSVVEGKGSTFVLTYDDVYTTEMREVMNDAALFWADWLRSDVPIEVAVQAPSLNCSFAYNAHIDWQPPETVINFPNAPIADTHYPIALANALAGTDLSPNKPDVYIRFNSKIITHNNCQKWYLGRDGQYEFGEYSLYLETIQEMGHHLGLAPLGDLMRGETLDGIPDIYWRHLKSSKLDRMLTDMTPAEIDQASHDYDNLAFKGEHSFAAAEHLTFGRTKDALLLFSRTYHAPQLTGMHLHESIDPYQIMMITRRGYNPEGVIAKAMMRDLGWPTMHNQAPVIEGQQPVSVSEDSQITLSLADFIVSDEQPDALTLLVGTGSHYTVQGTTIIPDTDFAGTLAVPVTVQDTEQSSNVFTAQISVTPVNDAPVIVEAQAQTMAEDSALTLTLAMLDIRDPDSSNFELQVLPGANYQVTGTTVAPSANWNGTLQVPVVVSDGALSSQSVSVTVNVTPVNDAPALVATEAQMIEEDTALTVTASMLTIQDPDSQTFTIQVQPGANYRVNGRTITPAESWTGTLSVGVAVSDGSLSSQTKVLTVQVVPVNDPPVLTGHAPLSTPEDTALTLSPGQFQFSDIDSSSHSVVIEAGEQYSVNGNTLMPAQNFNGELTVPVRIFDGLSLSNALLVPVTVTAVNDAPSLISTAAQTMPEDTSLTLTTAMVTVDDPDSTSFQLQVLPGANYDVTGTTIQPASNWYGSLSVSVAVSDGELSSAPQPMTVNVTPVNDPPVLLNTIDQVIDEDASLTVTTSMMTLQDPDSETFTIQLQPGANYSVDGQTITPADSWTGTLSVGVAVNDGELTSESQILTVQVNPVNDPPVLTGHAVLSTPEDTALTLSPGQFQFSDIDSTEHSVVMDAGEHYTVNGSTLMPAQNFNGELTVPVRIFDGDLLSNTLLVPVTVTAVNDAPELNAVTAQTIAEDTSLFVVRDMLDIVDPDSADFTIDIALGEHYQVAGNEIIPDPNWNGTLTIDLTVNDGQADSNTLSLTLTVSPVNDLPVITTQGLPTAQIYRPWEARLEAEDIDSDTLSFELANAPEWLSLSADGVLTALPNENMIGEQVIDVRVTDGQATTGQTLALTVLNDPTATDLSVAISANRTIWATNAWVPLTVTATNHGPMPLTDAQLTLRFAGEWTSEDPRCTPHNNVCLLTLTEDEAQSLRVDVRQQEIGSVDIETQISHNGFETQADNNRAQMTLTFTNGTPTSPQYSVPAFGQGTVRAIGIADIQGGRWPEILFANGPAEASTAYRFKHSLFRPVLHTHLADASDSYAMAVVDLNNDGHRDWVLANGHGEANTVYRNRGDGTFELIGQLGQADSRAVAYADIDRDGDIDLVFANNTDDNTLFLNDGTGQFTLGKTFPARNSRRVLLYDFNWDGYPDIVFANRGFRNRLYWNRGFGHRHNGHQNRNLLRIGEAPAAEDFDAAEFGDDTDLTTQMVLADLDGDGTAGELVLMHEGTEDQPAKLETLSISQQEQTTTLTSTDTGSVNDLSIGDYDGDGQDDVAVLRPGGALEIMSQRQGQLAVIDVMDTDGADTILMVDVDGSGEADVISANNNSNSSRLDFAGDVRDSESAVDGGSDSTPLPDAKSSGGRGGAGLPWLLLPLLLFGKRTFKRS